MKKGAKTEMKVYYSKRLSNPRNRDENNTQSKVDQVISHPITTISRKPD